MLFGNLRDDGGLWEASVLFFASAFLAEAPKLSLTGAAPTNEGQDQR
jgi:hypothetical protein